jgi:hypothetical protein
MVGIVIVCTLNDAGIDGLGLILATAVLCTGSMNPEGSLRMNESIVKIVQLTN